MEFGRALRQFHEVANMVRFQGHFGNIAYVPKQKKVILHDLDVSVGIEDIHPNAVGLSRVIDIESARYK